MATDFSHAVIALGPGGEADDIISAEAGGGADTDVTVDPSEFLILDSTDDTDVHAALLDADEVLDSIDDRVTTLEGASPAAGETYIFAAVADVTGSYADTSFIVPVVALKAVAFKLFVHFGSITNGQVAYVTTDTGPAGCVMRAIAHSAFASTGSQFAGYFGSSDQATCTPTASGEGLVVIEGTILGDASHSGNLKFQVKSQDGSGVVLGDSFVTYHAQP